MTSGAGAAMATLQLLLLALLAAPAAHAALRTSIELNSSLLPGKEPLYSSDNNPAFMLSFRSPSPSSTSATNLYLCISFVIKSSAPGQCVWVANRDTVVTGSASLTLSSTGNLILSDSVASGSHIMSSDTVGSGVTRALLLDTGNLVLTNSTSGYVWQSFHYPTDTLLPGQAFTAQSTSLSCNNRVGDFSSGRYSLSFTSGRVLQLFSSAGSHAYWDDWGEVESFSFDKLGNVTLFNSSSSLKSSLVANDYGKSAAARRMTLDMDGNLRMYTWDTAADVWTVVWMAFTDVCRQNRGLCGDYGVCTYNPTQPTCMCPPGFYVSDPTNLYGGCTANYTLAKCSTSVKYVELQNVDYPDNDYQSFLWKSIEECKNLCTRYCECKAAIYWQSGEYGKCWLKNRMANGYVPASQQHRSFLKISALDPAVSSPIRNIPTQWSSVHLFQLTNASSETQASIITYTKSNKYLTAVIALAIVLAVQTLCFIATVAGLIRRSRRQLRYVKLRGELEGSPLVCSYEELREATQNFSQKLGEGGFGTVYKGQLRNGKMVAVKQLQGISQQEKQFKAEITTIGRIHHINLVRLVGLCAEGTHRLLVYEYMERGSLDQLLFEGKGEEGDPAVDVLDWRTRFQICLGVARGMHYLHEECLDSILHCDIKPENILLDSSFCAKVADFGLAFLYSRDHTIQMTTIRGTRGYLAPEWVSNLPITSKADVYSYGMLIMEMVSGRRNYLFSNSTMNIEADEKWCFPVWAYGKRVEDVLDARLNGSLSSVDLTQVEAVLKVAFLCIQTDMNARPSMGKVVQMLEGNMPLPHAPAFSSLPSSNNAASLASSIPRRSSSYEKHSLSIS